MLELRLVWLLRNSHTPVPFIIDDKWSCNVVISKVSIIHEQEAMLGQIEFLKDYATTWKVSSPTKEIDRNEMTQLIHMIYYLKEGLEELYAREDNYILSKVELSNSGEIKYKHKAIINSLHKVYQLLIGFNSNMPMNKEYIYDTIDNLYQLILGLSVQENEIFQSYNN